MRLKCTVLLVKRILSFQQKGIIILHRTAFSTGWTVSIALWRIKSCWGVFIIFFDYIFDKKNGNNQVTNSISWNYMYKTFTTYAILLVKMIIKKCKYYARDVFFCLLFVVFVLFCFVFYLGEVVKVSCISLQIMFQCMYLLNRILNWFVVIS